MGEFPRKSDGRRVFTVEFVRGCAKGPDGDSASRGGHPPDTADRAPDGLLCRAGPAVRAVTSSRATHGYRRVWAMVNRTFRASYSRKRVRRLMRMHGLMLSPRSIVGMATASGPGATAGLEPALVLGHLPDPVLER